jgi:hypothetical protein
MKKWEIGAVVVLGILVALVFYFPILNSGNNLGIRDWDQDFAWTEFTRVSILNYHQFPLWNPFKCGGAAQFANPEIPVISLQTLFALIFGTVRGMKYSIYFHGVIGFIGFYLLAKQYKLSTLGSLLSSVIFSFGGITGSFLSSGMVVFTNFAYIPYVLLCFNKSLQNIKWGIICGALYALCFYSGYHISLLLGMFILIYTLVISIVKRTFNPFKTSIVVVITSAILMLPKLILSIQLIRTYPRLYTDVSGYSIYNFFYLLLSQNQNWFGKMNIHGAYNGIDENSIYVGILAFVLFLSFFVKNKKGILSNISLLITLLIFFWIMLGNSFSFSLYNGLKQLPVFSSFRVAQRFRFDFIIPFSLITGLGLDNVVRRLQRFKFVKPLSILFLLVIYIDLVILIIKNPEAQLPRGNAFIQSNISGAGFEIQQTIQLPNEFLTKKSFRPFSFEYLKIHQNIGELECYDTITSFIYPVGIEDQNYRGEYYLLNSAKDVNVENTYWSPNKLVYQISNVENTKDNTLIINQNYYPGWIVKGNKKACIRAISVNGLLATKLDSLSDSITFEYNPLLRWFVCRH